MQKSYAAKNALYLIPTPIGNMEDITIRALNTLKMVDILLCEDTRTTSVLLAKYAIKKKLVSCHEYNEEQMKTVIDTYLDEGKNVGLVTDQGTPIISDPGYKVVSYLLERGKTVISLPGATAFVPALTSSGLPPQPFLFYGFLNNKASSRKKELEQLKTVPCSILFYESPHRIAVMLQHLKEIFGNRRIALAREISKIHETYYYGTIEEVLQEVDTMKGEIVVVVEGNHTPVDYQNLSVVEHVDLYLADKMTLHEAMKQVAKERGVSKSVIYKEYHRKDGKKKER